MTIIKKIIRSIITKCFPELNVLAEDINWAYLKNTRDRNTVGQHVIVYSPCHVNDTIIGDYSYISYNSWISMTKIGKFCSIGPNVVCGWGIHPTDGISTSPSFYSLTPPNNKTFANNNKIKERKDIFIGNDVFIGANVTILDGITIGDGAVIGAGAVVSKNIPPFAVAVGCPIEIKGYRFPSDQIEALKHIKWWEFDEDKLKDVEQYFFDLNSFIEKYR